jgi:hypothetical protein
MRAFRSTGGPAGRRAGMWPRAERARRSTQTSGWGSRVVGSTLWIWSSSSRLPALHGFGWKG